MSTDDDVVTLIVDGETFTVTCRPAEGQYAYDWISGPNPDYGFSTTLHQAGGPRPHPPPPILTRTQHEQSIRDFLSQINPDTGYLD